LKLMQRIRRCLLTTAINSSAQQTLRIFTQDLTDDE
jgi:hypothetical protein